METANSEIINVRVSRKLRDALKRECKKISRVAGAEVTASAVVRACLEERLLDKPRPLSVSREKT
jgi:Na+-translocating ferredoxin:NAD+ oxidoreductase RnfG subunit